MTGDEHGKPQGATGAQGADSPANGESPNGNHGYSALTGGAAIPPAAQVDGSADGSGTGSANGASSAAAGYSAIGRAQGTDGDGTPADEAKPDEAKPDEAKPDEVQPDEVQPDEAAKRKRRASSWREVPLLVLVALIIALVIKTFVVQPFYIPSSSMENTLLVGDKVLVNKLIYHFRNIQPGDIVVFNGDGSWNPNPPTPKSASNPFARLYDETFRPLFSSIAGLFGTPVGQTDYIKRVIGTPGDHVVCCNAQGLVTVNGVPLHEKSYLFPGATPSEIRFNIVVPRGRLWVMGDNRAVSDDSRMRQSDPGAGTIPESKVIGRAFVIVWPPSQWRFLPIPATFGQPGIEKGSAAAAAQRAAAAELLGAKVAPGAPYVPLAAGVACAVPLTWLQRRARRRLSLRLRQWRMHRHS